MKTDLVPYIKRDLDLIKINPLVHKPAVLVHKPAVLSLIYMKTSKRIDLNVISNEELFNAEMLSNTIRINSIALNKAWFKSVNCVADVTSIRNNINNRLTEMRSVSRDGFINDNDILNNPHYSLIKDVVFNYRGGNDWTETFINLNDRERTKIFKWCHDRVALEALIALICLRKSLIPLYRIELDKEMKALSCNAHSMKPVLDDTELMKSIQDESAYLSNSISELEGSIEPSIIASLKRKGITFNHIRYTGFDNEYVKSNKPNSNELVSVQFSVNTKTRLKIPLTRTYKYSKITTLGGKFYDIYGYSNVIDNERLLRDFNIWIDSYRTFNYGLYDVHLESITQKLINRGVPNIKVDDFIIFDFGRSHIRQWIHRFSKGDTFKLEDLVKQSNRLTDSQLEEEYQTILVMLRTLSYDSLTPYKKDNNNFENLTALDSYSVVDSVEEVKKSDIWGKELEISRKVTLMPNPHEDSVSNYNRINKLDINSRDIKLSSLKSKIALRDITLNINRIYQNNLIGHFNSADISMYSDYEDYKTYLDIIKHSFVTIRRPLEIDGVRVKVYDSLLLSPASKKSLKELGMLYDLKMGKIELPDPSMIEKMNVLAYEDWNLFRLYALQDTVIPLVHCSFMEDFNFKLGCLGIPLTLSSLSVSMVKKFWNEQGYKGYQMLPDVKIGDSSVIQTPKILSKMGSTGEHLSLYIENCKGGRNESYMYGIDRTTEWFDHDLKGAYTTAMCLLGNPDYKKAVVLTYNNFMQMDKLDLLYSYTVLKVDFKFPDDVKFPNIPVFVDKDTTVYPLEGEAVLTYAEYVTAQRMGCDFKRIKEIFHIPFESLSSKSSKLRNPNPTLSDFESYSPDYVPYIFDNGSTRVMKLESTGDGKLKEVKDIKVIASCNSLTELEEILKSCGFTFEDFRQQPNNLMAVLSSIVENNEVDLKDRRDIIEFMIEYMIEFILEGMNDWISSVYYNTERLNNEVGKDLEHHFKPSKDLKRVPDLTSMNSFEKIDELLDLSSTILSIECDMVKHFKPFLADDKNDECGKFRCEGSRLYNIQILKLLKLSILGLDIMKLNSCISNEDLKSINLKGFDINEISILNISKPCWNVIESKDPKALINDVIESKDPKALINDVLVGGNFMKFESFCSLLVAKHKEYDTLRSQIDRVLYYKTPSKLSSSNFIAWPVDLIPVNKFGSSDTAYINGPYRNLIDFLQKERAKHAKKTIMNELYKEMANSVYGQTVRGIGVKNKIDVSTGEVKRMNVGELANPIIGSWITGFVRSVIGEMLYLTDKMGGRVVSVTTDGFIADIKDLEKDMVGFIEKEKADLIEKYDSFDDKGRDGDKRLVKPITYLKYKTVERKQELKNLDILMKSKQEDLNSNISLEIRGSLVSELKTLEVRFKKLNHLIRKADVDIKDYEVSMSRLLSLEKRNSKGGKGLIFTIIQPVLKGDDLILFEKDRSIMSVSLLNEYRLTREVLSGDPNATEIKTSGVGLASWCVRGQLGLESGISALTGFQKKGIGNKELFHLVTKSMTSFEKSLNYIQTSLRSATDIYKKGGHVTPINRDQVFRTVYDNRRVIEKTNDLQTKIKVISGDTSLEFLNVYSTLLDSKPMKDKEQCDSFRSIGKIVKDTVIYNITNRKPSNSLYVDSFDIALKQFIRALYSEKLKLNPKEFKFHKDLCIWLNEFEYDGVSGYINLNPNKVALIKSRGNYVNKSVPITAETKSFSEFVKVKFPKFDDSKFFKD